MLLKIAVLFSVLAVAYTRLRPRIVGGTNAKRNEFPYEVSLEWGIVSINSHICAGSILNNQWILTAGHCYAYPFGTYYVKAGTLSLVGNEPNTQYIEVDQFIVHNNYPGGVAPNDIALLKLKKPLVFTQSVQPIALPAGGSEVVGGVVVSGWGSVNHLGISQSNILQKANLTIIDPETCATALLNLLDSSAIDDSFICTGPLTGGVSTCRGDSGDPLVKTLQNGQRELVGVSVWGLIPCGTRGAPAVFTKVSSYIDWINDIIANN